MRSSLKSVIAISAMMLAVPTFAIADDVGGGDDLQELLGRMSDLEQQLRATNDALAASNARVDQQASQLGKIQSAPTGVLPTLSSFLTETEFSGWVSGTYFYNTNNPSNGHGVGANGGDSLAAPFHKDSNSFQVEQVWFAMENAATPESRGGFQVELVWGETADILRDNDNDDHNANDSYLYTANVSYLAPITDAGILVTAGRFATHIGAEVAQAPYNYNITRGMLYTQQPINHTGVKISSKYDNGLDWMLGVANTAGTNSLATQHDTDDEKTFLWRIGYEMSDTLAVGVNGLYGGDCSVNSGSSPGNVGRCNTSGTSKDKQGIVDVVINWDPSDKLSTYTEGMYGWSDFEGRNGGPSVMGVAAAGRYAFTDATGAAFRFEYLSFDDNYAEVARASDKDDHDLWSITATVDHALTEHLTVKAEIAYQEGSASKGSDQIFFYDDHKNGDITDDDSDVLLGVQMIYEF